VLRVSKWPEPANIVHYPSCIWHEPFCYSRRHRPTPKNTLRGIPGCAVGPKTPTPSATICLPPKPQRVRSIMNLVFWLLHLSEGLSKYNIHCTACVNQNIVDQKSFDNTRDNHSVIVRVILELKILLGEGNRVVRPS
jgi:hypothetical protein